MYTCVHGANSKSVLCAVVLYPESMLAMLLVAGGIDNSRDWSIGRRTASIMPLDAGHMHTAETHVDPHLALTDVHVGSHGSPRPTPRELPQESSRATEDQPEDGAMPPGLDAARSEATSLHLDAPGKKTKLYQSTNTDSDFTLNPRP